MNHRILLLLTLTLFASAAGAATYYVDDSGSNSNPGTLASPFRTITYGLTFIDGPNDVLYVRGGTYNEQVLIWNKHGNSNEEIWIKGYNGEKPVIDGTGIGDKNLVAINESSYVYFTGFVVQNSPRAGILVWDAHHINVEWNTVKTTVRSGIHAGTDNYGNTHHIVFKGNVVSDAVRMNLPGLNPGTWVQALSCYNSHDVVMTENWVSKSYGEGIDCVTSDNCTITKNTVWDNFGVNIYLDNAQYAKVDGNFVYNTGNTQYYNNGSPAVGIAVANEYYTVQNPVTNLTITNNIVLWCKTGFVYWNSQYGGGMHYSLIANNVFYHSHSSSTRLIYIEDGTSSNVHTNNTIDNNIFYQRSGVGYAWAPTVGFTWRTNSWYGGTSGTQITGVGDVTSDPLLVNAGGWNAADYKLSSTSPLKTAGTTESAVTIDHWGTARTASYSIGAHEY
ncbi:MAG TPA: right-handed parallel beta-helix repeat-containing protein [Thermoanaerobaculia bacterium]